MRGRNGGLMARERDIKIIDHAECAAEILALQHSDHREYRAVLHARATLAAQGAALGYPHTSAVRGSAMGLRELRPRAGHSRHRILYRRFGNSLVLLALVRDALIDARRFDRAVTDAERRAGDFLDEETGTSHV